MTKIQNSKQYDLEDRTLKFSKRINDYSRRISKDIVHYEILKQLIRAAGSVGANYIEANEALSKRDLLVRIKICRKEIKEARYWLKLTRPQDELFNVKGDLIEESTELMRIFGSIVEKIK